MSNEFRTIVEFKANVCSCKRPDGKCNDARACLARFYGKPMPKPWVKFVLEDEDDEPPRST